MIIVDQQKYRKERGMGQQSGFRITTEQHFVIESPTYHPHGNALISFVRRGLGTVTNTKNTNRKFLLRSVTISKD